MAKVRIENGYSKNQGWQKSEIRMAKLRIKNGSVSTTDGKS